MQGQDGEDVDAPQRSFLQEILPHKTPAESARSMSQLEGGGRALFGGCEGDHRSAYRASGIAS